MNAAKKISPRNAYNGVALRNQPMIFRGAAGAASFAGRCVKLHLVVLGEVGEFVVVCPSDFERLLRAGYEAA